MSLKVPTIFTAIDRMTMPLEKMAKSVGAFGRDAESAAARVERRFRKIGDAAQEVAKTSFIIGTAIAAPLVIAAKSAIDFEDRMADVAKTTGLVGKPLETLSNQLLDLAPNTRTSIEELQKIAAIGGQMGVAKNELFDFTKSVNEFNVALGSDFGGGVEEASKAIGTLRNLFKETRNLKFDEAITKTGSAINALSAKGVSVPELTDFAQRMGALPDAIKPSAQATLALGAVMNKAGITSEIAARGVGDVLLNAASNLPAFAKQLNLTNEATQQLINTSPEKFLAAFAKSLQGLDAEQLAKQLKNLKIGDTGTIKVVGSLSTAIGQLNDFKNLSNDAFAKGTSIVDEYNVKNNTTAAMLAKSKNSFEAFGIILGRELLPVINDLALAIIPAIKDTMNWMKENKTLVGVLVKTAVAIAAISFLISGISAIIAIGSQAVVIFTQLSSAFALMGGFLSNSIIPALQFLWAAFVVVIEALMAFLGVGLAGFAAIVAVVLYLISLFYSIYENWEMITAAFKNGGIIEGLKAIGKVMLDAILLPLQKVLEMTANLTGFEWAQNAAASVEKFRAEMGVNMGEDIKPINSEAVKQETLINTVKTNQQNVAIDINDNTGRATVNNSGGIVPVNVTPTFALW